MGIFARILARILVSKTRKFKFQRASTVDCLAGLDLSPKGGSELFRVERVDGEIRNINASLLSSPAINYIVAIK
jgi:hypothetical protein